MYVLEKNLQNIVRVDVDVSRGSNVLEMRDAQGYTRAPKTIFFNPKLEKNPNHVCFKNTVDPIFLSLTLLTLMGTLASSSLNS